jgi:cobalt-zinc-cadmium efflux system membrane fusion protein
LELLGADPKHDRAMTPLVEVDAPVSGVITEQNVTAAAGVKSLDNAPNLFTISDLSRVWIICDVPENQLALIREGDAAEIRVDAYPDEPLTGRIANISAVLDPAIRTAKVRIEVANQGRLRFGMFVTATFHGGAAETRAVVPASAVLHLRDHDWVYVPLEAGRFARREVVADRMRPGNVQELRSGLRPGERVVKNALVLQNTTGQ